jgi:hypothetical protein
MQYEKLSSDILSIPEFFSLGWSVFKKNLLTILYLVLSVQIPLQILYYYIDSHFLSIVVTSPISILLPMGIAYIVERQVKNETVGIKDVYTKLLPLWPAGIFAYYLSLLIIFGTTILLLIPGLICFIYLNFVLPAVVLREKKWRSALEYSWSLVKGQWWPVFGYALVFTVIMVPLLLIYVFAKQYVLLAVTSTAINTVVGAYSSILSVLLFLNLDNLKKAESAAA